MAGMGMTREAVLEVFEHVQRVLSINEFAGEKAIPESIKSRFRLATPDEALERRALRASDRIIEQHYGLTQQELSVLVDKNMTCHPNNLD